MVISHSFKMYFLSREICPSSSWLNTVSVHVGRGRETRRPVVSLFFCNDTILYLEDIFCATYVLKHRKCNRKRHKQSVCCQQKRVCWLAVTAQDMSVTDKGRNPAQPTLPAHLLKSLRDANIHDTDTCTIHEKLQQRTCSQMQSYLQLVLIRLQKMHISGNDYVKQLSTHQQRVEFSQVLKSRVQHLHTDCSG